MNDVLAPLFDAMPAELRRRPQWVVWKRDPIPGKDTLGKVPYTPGTNAKALTTKPATWRPFEGARAAYLAGGYDGIGFVFSAGDPFFGVDLDAMRDPDTGILTEHAQTLVTRFATYAEVSPSGTGVHLIGIGSLPGEGLHPRGLGVFDHDRYFVMTGRHIEQTPSEPQYVNGPLVDLYATMAPPPRAPAPPRQTGASLSDSDVIEKACRASNGTAFRALWDGDTSAYGGDHSAADLAFCNRLAFYTGRDAGQMDRLFRQSRLMREKWDSRRGTGTYGSDTIDLAIAECAAVFGSSHQSFRDSPRIEPLRTPERTPQEPDFGPPLDDEPIPPDAGPPLADDGDGTPKQYQLTDYGNGQRYADAYHGQLTFARYGADTGDWRAWDGTRWPITVHDELAERAGQLTRRLLLDGLSAFDTQSGKDLVKHALKSQSEGRLNAMINLAKNGLGTWARDYDADPWLLNCTNGTLDLRTAILASHDPTDLISKCTGIAYRADALCPTFDAFMLSIMPVVETRDYFQEAAGYMLTGSTREQCLFFAYGTGKNGKTTLMTALRHILGDYATTTRGDTFLAKKNDSGANYDIADLLGARLVTAAEPDEGKRIAESLIKELTGQDAMKARFLYKDFFSFIPTFKLIIQANHKPVIRGTDEGIWRRIRLIPFTVQIDEKDQDKDLPDKLMAESQGILRWAVEGCIRWQQRGRLDPPPEVQQAGADYREDMDVLGAFLRDCCMTEKDEVTPKADIYAAYAGWVDRSNEYKMSVTMFSRRMGERGFREFNNGIVRSWRGLKVRPTPPNFGERDF